MYVCVHVRMYVCMYVYVHVYVCTYACVYVYMYVYICVCMYKCLVHNGLNITGTHKSCTDGHTKLDSQILSITEDSDVKDTFETNRRSHDWYIWQVHQYLCIVQPVVGVATMLRDGRAVVRIPTGLRMRGEIIYCTGDNCTSRNFTEM